jgi:hypothetical protein
MRPCCDFRNHTRELLVQFFLRCNTFPQHSAIACDNRCCGLIACGFDRQQTPHGTTISLKARSSVNRWGERRTAKKGLNQKNTGCPFAGYLDRQRIASESNCFKNRLRGMSRITIVIPFCHNDPGANHLAIHVAVCALPSRFSSHFSVRFLVAIIDPC